MILYLTAETATRDLIIENITVKTKDERKILLTWDESDISREDGGFTARYKGVYFDDDYANGRIKELYDCEICETLLSSETDYPDDDFIITEAEFVDGDESYSLNIIM